MAIKEFPNNWKAYKDAPDDMFERHTFEEVMDWKVAGWELPSSVECIIRSTDQDTKQITERWYKTKARAKKRVMNLMNAGGYEITVVDHDSIHHLYPKTNEENE